MAATVTEIARAADANVDATVVATVGDITPLTSGHVIVVCHINDNEVLTAGDLTDTDSLTWQLDHSTRSNSNSTYVFSAEITSGSVDDGHTFTVDNNGVDAGRKGLIVYHVDGLASGTWLDEVGQANENSDTSVDATLDASTDEDNTLVFLAGSAVGDGSVAWTPDGDDGDVQDISTNRVMFTSWHEETSAGTHSEGGDKDHTGNWRAVILAYILDTGGGPGETDLTAAGAIASAEAFGTARIIRVARNAGAIATAEAFGVPSVRLVARPVGLASLEALGAPALRRFVRPLGVVSLEAFGDPRLTRWVRQAGGIASAEALGSPTVGITLLFSVGGIASAEAFGTARVVRIVRPIGIASAEAFGTPRVSRWVRQAGGIASAVALGQPTLGITLLSAVGGIASAEAHGQPRLVRIVQPVGIASLEAFGTAALRRHVRNAGAIASAEAFGVARLVRILRPLGVATAEAFGTPRANRILFPVGASSAEAFGSPQLARIIRAQGIAGLEAFGTPRLVRILLPIGVESLEEFGIAELLGGIPPEPSEGAVYGEVLVSDFLRFGVLVEDASPYLVVVSDDERFGLAISDDDPFAVTISDLERFGAEISDRPGG